MSQRRSQLAARYAAIIDRWRWPVLALALATAGLGAWQALSIPVRPAFSNLLPPTQTSVLDLRAIERRAQTFGTVFIVVESDDTELRARAMADLAERFRGIDPALLSVVKTDDRAGRQFLWENRFLFADLADLTSARDALADKIRRAKLAANPFYIPLDDEEEEAEAAASDQRLKELRERFDEAESAANEPTRFVSKDGRMQFLTLRSTFPTSDTIRANKLMSAVERIVEQARVAFAPAATVSITGTVPAALNESKAVLRGMTNAAIITILLCAIALLLYYRSLLAVGASLFSLAIGVLATFAFTKLSIGHFNIMSAFLIAIVVGNGINAGLILMARYFEELRADSGGDDESQPGTGAESERLGRALAGAARATLAATLTASVAYGSLIITDFRGFRHFGIIAGVGMVLCWISAFTVLPAALCVLRRRRLLRVRREPAIGRLLAKVIPRRPLTAVAVSLVLALIAAVASGLYISSDPYLKDWRELRSTGPELKAASDLDLRMRDAFGKGHFMGQSSRFAVAVDRRSDVRPLVTRLRSIKAARPEGKELFHSVNSVDDFLPAEQDTKLVLLDEIRSMLTDDFMAELSPEDRALIDKLRPPPELSAMTIEDLPHELIWPFIEKDGRIGSLIFVRGHARFKSWDVAHRVEFAREVRAIDLPTGALVGGQSFVIADIIQTVENDAPLAIIVAFFGSILVVWGIVGMRRHGIVTLLCAVVGIGGMIALCSAFSLRVHFLDLIALPITIGIGIDYAVNLAERERQDWQGGARGVLTTTGGAVLLCSFTTIVGYGSLLLSNNGGISSFGLAAILGEIACLLSAIFLAPPLLQLLRERDESEPDEPEAA